MSGVKTVTVNRTEYERMQAAESRLRSVQQDLPEVLAATRRQSAAELQNRLLPLEQRQQKFQSDLRGVSADIRQVEAQTAQRLEQQQREFRQAMGRSEQTLRQEMAGQENRLNTRIDQERAARIRQIQKVQADMTNLITRESKLRQDQVRGLQQQLNAIALNEQRKSEIAQSWITAAQTIGQFIEQNYRHAELAPARLAALTRGLQQAQNNAKDKIFEAAITKAQDVYSGLSDLRLELERLEHEWQVWRNTALEETRTLFKLAHSNRHCTIQDSQGKDLNLKVEVDWWTGGRLVALETEISEIVAKIEKEYTVLSTEDLRQIAEIMAPDLRQRLDHLLDEARAAVFGSQARVNIAQLTVEALQEQGYTLDGTTYEGNDMRHGFAAKVRHIDGGEVMVFVEPVEGQTGQNELRILSFDDALRTDYEREQRAAEVNASLHKRGVPTGAIAKAGERPDVADRDLQKIQKRQPKSRVKPVQMNTETTGVPKKSQAG